MTLHSIARRRLAPGFSLLEVLVALVVLSTGILGISWLQASLAKSTGDSKMQSYAIGIAQAELERIRADTTDNTKYVALDDEAAKNVGGSVEATGTQFRIARTVTEYNLLPEASASCTPYPCFEESATGSADVTVPGYKHVVVTVTWTAADSAADYDRSVAVSGNISKLGTGGMFDVMKDLSSGSGGGPVIIASKSSLGLDAAGVIPIATGGEGGEATAATNPKPIVDNTTGTATVKFSLLNYQDGGTGNVLVQRQTETEILSCKCEYGSFDDDVGDALSTAMRPTYWTGNSYTSPKSASAEGITVPEAIAASTESYGTSSRNIQQSPHCDICCRDHHDPSTMASDKVKFDPYRSSKHSHYIYPLDASGNTTIAPVEVSVSTGKIYAESCRVIKVDGVWSTAVDMNAAHVGLLATNQVSSGGKTAWAPTTSAATSYAGFVNDYLTDSLLNISGSVANIKQVALGKSEITSLEDAQSPSLNSPDKVGIATNSATKRYLHARALYLDELSDEGIEYLDRLLANCTVSDKLNCVLSYLPFAPLNVTELAMWAAKVGKISITNNALDASDVSEPQRGVVTPVLATNGDDDVGFARLWASNSGLSFALPIDPEDGIDVVTYPASRFSDSQNFKFSGNGELDDDSDGDGVEDSSDNCPKDANSDQEDSDADGLGNACDDDFVDSDGDGVDDTKDNCPAKSNSGQGDADSDGIGDACDDDYTEVDSDGDGISDLGDNCPAVSNASQSDSDGDGIGDACDAVVLPDLDYTIKLIASGANFSPNPSMYWTPTPSNGSPGDNCTVTSANGATPLVYSCPGTTSATQTVRISNFNRIYFQSINGNSPNNDCQFKLDGVTYGPKHIDHVVCVIYAPGTLNGNAGVIGGSATAFSGTALQSAIVSNVNPANNQFVEYPLSGITDGATYQATFTSKLINLNDLGKGTGYTCDANGYPVYNFSQCK